MRISGIFLALLWCSLTAMQPAQARNDPAEPQPSVTELKHSCDGGVAKACGELGYLMQNGAGIRKDYRASNILFGRACDGGDMYGCYNLALNYYNGVGVSQNKPQAAAIYERSCSGGVSWACVNLGLMYFNGDGTAQNQSLAADIFRKACDSSDPMACSQLAYMTETGAGVDADVAAAARLFTKACSVGDQPSCAKAQNLAFAANQAGVAAANQKDFRAAEQQLSAACDGGIAIGCSSLGVMYRNGDGVEQSQIYAAQLFSMACDRGAMLGCFYLAEATYKGAGLPQNRARAAELYKQACDGGVAIGCEGLAFMTERGDGTTNNLEVARGLFAKACAGGRQDACTHHVQQANAQAASGLPKPTQGSLNQAGLGSDRAASNGKGQLDHKTAYETDVRCSLWYIMKLQAIEDSKVNTDLAEEIKKRKEIYANAAWSEGRTLGYSDEVIGEYQRNYFEVNFEPILDDVKALQAISNGCGSDYSRRFKQ